ncbi:MAG: hypothetical protein EHM45_12770 [Desulfobacteraceae bacterium]|nr:MAG: hypothetical protein EHM45_12770 [Desulfobacteraceae bacterium]
MAEKQSNEKDDNQYIIHVSVNSDPFIQAETTIPGKFAGSQENYFAEQAEKFISGHAVLSKMNRSDLSIAVTHKQSGKLKKNNSFEKQFKEKTM